MSTEEVPLQTKASPACLEREDHVVIVSDGLWDVQIGLFIVRPARSAWSVSILLYVDDIVIAGANLDEIVCVKL